MISNFALSLSFEGIELLHRVPRGWRRIGRADVASETLDADLANLREKAEALAPDGLRTKLIIPLDQIKYTAIDSTLTTQDDIHDVLEGATPYALDDLVIDCERFGGRTHIAAVARETLQEAEAFAAAHGFNPIAFVAVPEPFTFQKEVFFGPTSMMTTVLGPDGIVARDDLPVMVVGTRIKSRLLVFDLPEEVQEEAHKDDLADLLAPQPKKDKPADEVATDVPDNVTVDPEPEVVAVDPEPEAITVDPEPEVEAVDPEPKPVAMDPVSEAEAKAKAKVEASFDVVAETPVDVEEETTADIQADAALDVKTEAVIDVEPDTPPHEPAPIQQIWIDQVPAEYHAPVVAPEVVVEPEPTAPLIPENPILATPPLLDSVIAEYHPKKQHPKKAPLAAIASSGSAKAPKLGAVAPVANRAKAPLVAQNRNKAPLVAAGIAATVLLFGGLIWALQEPDDIAAVPVAAPEPVAATEAPTLAPAPAEQVETATASLEAGPQTPDIAIADFGIADTDGGALPVFALDTRPTVLAVPETPSAAEADPVPAPVQAPPAPPEPETAQASVGAPILRGQVLSPAEADRIYQATGVWQRAPRFLDVPNGVIPFEFLPPNTTTPPDRVAQPDVPLLDGLETDLSFITPANPPAPEVTFPLDENGFILATPEGTLTPEGAVVIAGLPDLTITPRPALTEADLTRMALLAPAPEGVIIIAGRPDPLPPLRPANAQLPESAVAPAEASADLEPPTVPASETGEPTPGSVGFAALELQNDGAVALDSSVVEDGAIVDLRPQLRPQGLAPAVDPGTPDITDIIAGIVDADDATLRFDNSTSLAVVLSPRPDMRPANFSNVVASARARLETQRAPAPAPAAPAPVTAAAPVPPQNFGPVPGGVARAATQEDAIRLREVNLIGVYGRPNARRALVRLSNGRYVRVEVGSALDGGQVTAIGDDALNYVKRGRTYAIELP